MPKHRGLTARVMIAKPHSASAVHHHGEEGTSISPALSQFLTHYLSDTIVYAASGHGAIVWGPNGSKRQELSPGDFALIPAFAEHQEVNDSDAEVKWIITRGGRNPIVHNLDGWGKS